MNAKQSVSGKASKKASKANNRAAASQPHLLLQALEPRVLLDAAAALTAQEAIPDTPAAAPEGAAHYDDLMAALAPATPAADTPALASAQVYFVDTAVADAAALVRGLPPGAEVHFIDAQVDGVQFIADTLRGRSDISAIHVLGHGEAGALQLGNAALTAQSMQGSYRDELVAIGQSLTAAGDILIYGCDFGEGSVGAKAVQILAKLTGADVAASTDDTGAATLGGNWVLEREAGVVETVAIHADDWEHTLVAPVLDTTKNLGFTGLEDAPAPQAGQAVGVLVSDYTVGMSDTDPGAIKGIAIIGNTTTNGTWWYTSDGGASWATVGTVSTTSALLLPLQAGQSSSRRSTPRSRQRATTSLLSSCLGTSANTANPSAPRTIARGSPASRSPRQSFRRSMACAHCRASARSPTRRPWSCTPSIFTSTTRRCSPNWRGLPPPAWSLPCNWMTA